MKTELKTLENMPKILSTVDLKAEAVKWVKTFDKRFRDRGEFKSGAYWFCFHFFNLTEEDLAG